MAVRQTAVSLRVASLNVFDSRAANKISNLESKSAFAFLESLDRSMRLPTTDRVRSINCCEDATLAIVGGSSCGAGGSLYPCVAGVFTDGVDIGGIASTPVVTGGGPSVAVTGGGVEEGIIIGPPIPTPTPTPMQPEPDVPPSLTRTHDSVIRFCNIPRRCYPPNASAQEITRCNMDRSYTLDTVLQQLGPQAHAALLGELQFSFVCFLVGHVFDAFEQWKKLVALFCSCEDAITKYPKLFHDFIGVLHYQIREAPSDFFLDAISNNNFLVAVLQNFFLILRESGADPELQKRALVFKESLARFNWDFEEEDDDDLPVVVDLS
eukprot:m.140002 g.140002  ORF g.140002 m.140002 type:complete len:323 (+) comp30096_c0_seq2:395-1363(+)